MKKTIITIGVSAIAAISASAQGLVAGWDFSDITNFAADHVNGYAAEKFSYTNNGFITTGTIYTDGTNGSTALVQNTEVQFFAAGRKAGAPGFLDGFEQLNTHTYLEPATGQQSLAIFGHNGSFNVVFGFTTVDNDAVFNFDFMNQTAGVLTDFIDVSYSNDGVNYLPYEPVAPGQDYWQGGTQSWVTSNDNRGGLTTALGGGQTDGVVDLTGLGQVSFVRLEFSGLAVDEAVFIDNVHIAGTAVPEPSAFAAIAGALALVFVGARRRK